MTLPATWIEASALQYAVEFIAACQQGDFLNLGCAPLHSDAGRALLRRFLKHYACQHAFNMDTLVASAQAGWEDADIALRQLIADHVDRGEPLPSVLAAYNVRLINPSMARPQKPRGDWATFEHKGSLPVRQNESADRSTDRAGSRPIAAQNFRE